MITVFKAMFAWLSFLFGKETDQERKQELREEDHLPFDKIRYHD